jgi:hypothetical protein
LKKRCQCGVFLDILLVIGAVIRALLLDLRALVFTERCGRRQISIRFGWITLS